MEKNIILDGNKLIAKFMDLDLPLLHIEYDRISLKNGTHKVDDFTNYSWKTNIKYHKSWDWLMPVVEKIEILMTNWNIPNYKNGYSEWMDKFRFAFWDIKCLYKYVVEFIEWYNENNRNNKNRSN